MPRLPKGQRPQRMQVIVPPFAYEAVERLEAVTGQDRKVVVGKTLEWLARQPETVQKFIIFAMPESLRPEFARMVLEKMASSPGETEAEREHLRQGLRDAEQAERDTARPPRPAPRRSRAGNA